MKIKITRFLYEAFDKCKFIENDLDWITGHSNRENMKNINYDNINYLNNDLVEIEISESILNLISKEIGSVKLSDIEKSINILYLSLYVLGGTS